MASLQRFEDIEAWQKGRELTRRVYQITSTGCFERDFGLKHQFRRAAVSIISNIAEGFERGGNKEFRQFLATAKGSAAEVKAQLYVAWDAGHISETEFQKLSGECQSITLLLGGFIKYLKSSEMLGRKFSDATNRKNPER
jgi:four helix bundle protein